MAEDKDNIDTQKVEIKSDIKIIASRFGDIKVNIKKQLYFHYGMLGVCGSSNFCVAEFPDKETGFKIFQSMDNAELSFIVLPLNHDEAGEYPLYSKTDIDHLTKECEVKKEDLVILLVAVFEKSSDGREHIYVNMQAPLVLDAEKKAGMQFVFDNDKFDARYELTIE